MRTFKLSRQITVRHSNVINAYFREISKLQPLKPEEEANLARRAKKGDAAAAEKLVKANLRFVVSVAKRYQNQGLELEELIQEGNLGLMKAIRKYDETKGFRLISYAVWWIRQSILSALAQHSRLVRLPANRVSAIHKVREAQESLEQRFHRAPRVEEICEVLAEFSPEEVVEVLRYYRSSSLSLTASEAEEQGEGGTLIEKIANPHAATPDSELQSQSLSADIQRCLGGLKKRDAEVLCLYFGIGYGQPHTLEEIGQRINLTRERVRQIKEKAIRNLHSNKNSRLLREHLD